MAAKRDNFGPTSGHHLPAMNLRCGQDGAAWARMASKMVQAAPVWAKMARKMAQPRNKMGHPDLSVGGSRRFREVFSEGFWLKVSRF